MVLDFTTWPSRTETVMDSLDAVAAVCDGNPNSAVLVLGPIFHSNVGREAIVIKRRNLEDRLFKCLCSVQ